MILSNAVHRVLRHLDDELAEVWTNEEIALYIKDGYDLFCRRTKMLFDIHMIENVPQTGNWGSDLERYLGENRPGFGLTDSRLNFTNERERDLGIGGAVGQSTEGPTPATSPPEGTQFDNFSLMTKVATGQLPNSTVEVLRVVYDDVELFPEEQAELRRLDPQFEIREGGDPRWFTFGNDGLFTIRLIPPARGEANYHTVNGSWGIRTQRLASDIIGLFSPTNGNCPILQQSVGKSFLRAAYYFGPGSGVTDFIFTVTFRNTNGVLDTVGGEFESSNSGPFILDILGVAAGGVISVTIDDMVGTPTTDVFQVFEFAEGIPSGTYGFLKEHVNSFPAGGPHGSPTRSHPLCKNIKVETIRLGRSLDHYEFEIPASFIKYPLFWAKSRALRRDGVGQDLKLSQHYADRFELGCQRAITRLKHRQKERILRMGFGSNPKDNFALGMPQLPFPYGPATGR